MQSSEERPIVPGDRLDGYVIGSRIGKGATAWVFEATHEATDEVVAIKVMRPDVREDSSLRARFERELDALDRIQCHHVPQLYDTGDLECGLPYMVMERLRGGTLHDRLTEDAQLTTTFAIELATQLTAALSAAHAAGVVHRDVKPSNIVLHEGPDDVLVLKLVDFGICMPIGEDEPKLTLPGKTVGTPDYMSPEQARGLPLDGRSDVFSAGSVLYEMLTGRSPFGGRSAKAIARAVTRKEPRPLEELRPDCPAALVAVVTRAMAKEREDRFPSADALHEALLELTESLGDALDRGATLAMTAAAPERPRLELHPELDDDDDFDHRRAPPPSKDTDIIELPKRPPWQRAAMAAIVMLGMGWGALHVTGQAETVYDLAIGDDAAVRVNAVAVAEASEREPGELRKTVAVDSLDALARLASGPVAMPDVAALSRADARLETDARSEAEADGTGVDAAGEDAADDDAARDESEARPTARRRARRDPPTTTVMMSSNTPSARVVSSRSLEEEIDEATQQIDGIQVPSGWDGSGEPGDVSMPGNPY